MKTRPILFSDSMVRAILDDRKSQTRRVMKPNDRWRARGDGEPDWVPAPLETGEWGWVADGCTVGIIGRCPYGEPGDHLWVREAWQTGVVLDALNATQIASQAEDAGWSVGPGHPAGPVRFHADGAVLRWGDNDARYFGEWGRRRLGRFMPRWASRLTLIVTDVRVERVQAITEEDARAEGVGTGDDGIGVLSNGAVVPVRTYRGGFRYGWNALNAKRGHGWDLNDWVWVIGFKMLRGAT